MRYFPILMMFVLAFGGAAVFYEKESRKIKGVHSQITDLQAKVGDLQAEVNRLSSELAAAKASDRRRPSLRSITRAGARPTEPAGGAGQREAGRNTDRGLVASDVTSSGPAIRRGEEEDEWSRPTVDAERYRPGSEEDASQEPVEDPYQ
ncbi:hypothetical protein [Microbulbifer yueqingensis]|uniref:Uncharacterized protein n=1 Tax=Microbulbifer yueqingensis TaxID=658219 RepID=A0A1G9ABN3_9GAMM|nr:hypothetical protein [Microbulbifer yueqingensis]SDK24653.1 hypothetical protein SAMN05216212_1932 [Microbulbifer yueqingensis]